MEESESGTESVSSRSTWLALPQMSWKIIVTTLKTCFRHILLLSPMSLPPSESTSLLHNGSPPNRSFPQRIATLIKAEGEPSWLASYKWFIFGSYLNVLLIFIPLSFLSHNLHWDAAFRFSFSFFAIIPLAKVPPIL